MYNVRQREFTAPNGEKRIFSFRDGTNDEPTIIACFEEDYYKVLERGLKAGDVAVDLGAHIGAVTSLLSTIPGLLVYGVEVLPENYNLLEENMNEQNTNVSIFKGAIWHEAGTVDVSYGDDGTENGRVHNFMGNVGKNSNLQSVSVPTITLPDLFKTLQITHCDFLKIDIEGAEEKIFTSLPLDVLHSIKYIIGEYHNNTFNDFFPFNDDYNIKRFPDASFICERKNHARK